MKLERLQEILEYDPLSGSVTIKKSGRRIFPDEDGIISIYDSKTKKRPKFKFNRLCWMLGNNKIPNPTDKVIHRNLKEHDTSLCNLYLVSNEEYKKYKNAHKNLTGGIRLTVHPKDAYCYNVHWYEGATEKTHFVSDIVVAKKLETKLRLRFSKILTKYCYSEP